MFQIIVTVKHSETNFLFSYKSEATATKALENLWEQINNNWSLKMKDDYGHVGVFPPQSISGAIYAEQAEELRANFEREIVNKRLNKEFQERVLGDLDLKILFSRPSIAQAHNSGTA